MTWHLTDDIEMFRKAAGGLLAADPARSSVLLTVSETARAGVWPEIRSGWWVCGGTVAGAFLQTPPFPPLLGPMPPEAARELAGELRGISPTGVNGVNGESDAALAFGRAWGPYEVERAERLFGLAELTGPTSVAGRARIAAMADLPLLTAWLEAFSTEAGLSSGQHVGELAARRIAAGQLVLWEAEAEGPVSLAATSAVLAGHARIGPVYTPPELRGHGYAAAATSAATRLAQGRGAGHVVLFTDLANPTSNALYQRLGYRRLRDHLSLTFTDRVPVGRRPERR
ncbi:GNAT family N-acetyltransferase [Streptomyces sp. NPDC006632]|uniref:GNAT family N-acetyltransferase n=1 Tax=unclassified Streptomyces TaxID=2593676 RepID=UPI002E21AC26